MRQLTIIIALFITIIITACDYTKFFDDKKIIDLTTVDFIEIRNTYRQENFNHTEIKRLTNEQAEVFIDKWNNAKPKGPCKYAYIFSINVTFKDGTKRTFIINGKSIKESSDNCFDLGDNNYAETLWNLAEKIDE
ncbi:MAG: hypothetical protein NTW25_05380 [Candidatus Kapabacteria bacterium]|nr:hypothetical protein [Candidatus Kapabacteria bacterium]